MVLELINTCLFMLISLEVSSASRNFCVCSLGYSLPPLRSKVEEQQKQLCGLGNRGYSFELFQHLSWDISRILAIMGHLSKKLPCSFFFLGKIKKKKRCLVSDYCSREHNKHQRSCLEFVSCCHDISAPAKERNNTQIYVKIHFVSYVNL